MTSNLKVVDSLNAVIDATDPYRVNFFTRILRKFHIPPLTKAPRLSQRLANEDLNQFMKTLRQLAKILPKDLTEENTNGYIITLLHDPEFIRALNRLKQDNQLLRAFKIYWEDKHRGEKITTTQLIYKPGKYHILQSPLKISQSLNLPQGAVIETPFKRYDDKHPVPINTVLPEKTIFKNLALKSIKAQSSLVEIPKNLVIAEPIELSNSIKIPGNNVISNKDKIIELRSYKKLRHHLDPLIEKEINKSWQFLKKLLPKDLGGFNEDEAQQMNEIFRVAIPNYRGFRQEIIFFINILIIIIFCLSCGFGSSYAVRKMLGLINTPIFDVLSILMGWCLMFPITSFVNLLYTEDNLPQFSNTLFGKTHSLSLYWITHRVNTYGRIETLSRQKKILLLLGTLIIFSMAVTQSVFVGDTLAKTAFFSGHPWIYITVSLIQTIVIFSLITKTFIEMLWADNWSEGFFPKKHRYDNHQKLSAEIKSRERLYKIILPAALILAIIVLIAGNLVSVVPFANIIATIFQLGKPTLGLYYMSLVFCGLTATLGLLHFITRNMSRTAEDIAYGDYHLGNPKQLAPIMINAWGTASIGALGIIMVADSFGFSISFGVISFSLLIFIGSFMLSFSVASIIQKPEKNNEEYHLQKLLTQKFNTKPNPFHQYANKNFNLFSALLRDNSARTSPDSDDEIQSVEKTF